MKKNENIPLNFKERSNSRISFIVSIAVLIVLCVIFNQVDYNMIRKPAQDAKKAQEKQEEKEEQEVAAASETYTATVLAVGDNLVQPSLLSSGQYESGTWNYDHAYANMKSLISAADVAIVNQETPFTTDHNAVSGTAPYQTPTEVGDALVNAGFDVVTSAAYLMRGNGLNALGDTVSYWSNQSSVTFLGVHASSDTSGAKIREVNGIKIAFLDYTYPVYGASDTSSSEESSESETSEGTTGDTASGDTTSGYTIDTLNTTKVAAAIADAKAKADVVIFCANWGKTEEPMPTEYEKEWANFLMENGVDVVIGTNPNVLQPYGYLTDDSGHNMLIYYSLGNFITGQETLKQLLGGMASFTIEKTVTGDETTVKVKDATLTPLVMHYSYDDGEYTPYLLSDYTEELAAKHSVRDIIGEEFSAANLQTKYDEIMSMKVTPSSKTDFLDYSFDSDGTIYDSSGNWVEDTDSITSGQYYTNLSGQDSSESGSEETTE